MMHGADGKTLVLSALSAQAAAQTNFEAVVASAPARLDVSGGMAVYAGGVVAQSSFSLRATAGIAPRADGSLWMADCTMPFTQAAQIAFDMQAVLSGALEPPITNNACEPPAWAKLILTTVLEFNRVAATPTAAALRRGLSISVHNPIDAGRSPASASAMAAALVQCLCLHFEISAGVIEKAHLIASIQRSLRGGRSHAVDALTVLCAHDGPPTHLLRYRSQPHELLGQIPLSHELQLLAIEIEQTNAAAPSTAESVLTAGAMGAQIIETIYRDLGHEPAGRPFYLGNISPGLYKRYFRALLPRRLRGRDFTRTYGPLPQDSIEADYVYHVRAAVDHLIGESEYAENFLQAMEELAPNSDERTPGAARRVNAQRAGRLLLASQHSYRLRLGLSSPAADWLIARLTDTQVVHCAYGARVTDMGDGGLVVALLPHTAGATDHLLGVISDYGRHFGSAARVYRAGEKHCGGTLLG